MLAMESAASVRCLYKHFLSKITKKSLNAFYYACSYAKVDYSRFMNITASMALNLIADELKSQPVFLCLDDTMVSKFGKQFENVSKLFDHAAHNGSNYLNGHCFVSLMLCIPVWKEGKMVYLSVPLGYRMWQKKETKLELAASMVRQVMPEFQKKKNVILLCDSWYMKKNLLSVIDEYKNLDLIGNARYDSVIYDLAPPPTGRRGRPAKRGNRLSIEKDFTLSDDKIGDYYTGCKKVLTNIFGSREVMAYVTATKTDGGSRSLFFSTIFPEQLDMVPAFQPKKVSCNQQKDIPKQYLPLFLYAFRWNIEVSYYEQKTFWSLCSYMLRSCEGIELFVNLINISYCAMKLLPYQDESFAKFRTESVQDFRFALSELIRQQIFLSTFLKNILTTFNSNAFVKAFIHLLFRQGFFL